LGIENNGLEIEGVLTTVLIDTVIGLEDSVVQSVFVVDASSVIYVKSVSQFNGKQFPIGGRYGLTSDPTNEFTFIDGAEEYVLSSSGAAPSGYTDPRDYQTTKENLSAILLPYPNSND